MCSQPNNMDQNQVKLRSIKYAKYLSHIDMFNPLTIQQVLKVHDKFSAR